MAARKANPIVELAAKMLHQLETQRGGEAYPLSLRRLAELADPLALPEQVVKAAANKAFTNRALTAYKDKKDLDAPVTLVEDADRLAAGPLLLESLLESVCTPEQPVWTISKLKGKVHNLLKQRFEESIQRQVSENRLPASVGSTLVRKVPHLYLARLPPPPPPAKPPPPAVALGIKLLKELESRKIAGQALYPTTLTELASLADAAASPALLKKALATEPFRSQVVLAVKNALRAPVAFAADAEMLAGSTAVLDFLLELLQSSRDHAFTRDKLKAKLVPELRDSFVEALDERLRTGTLPAGVAWVLVGGKKLLLLTRNLNGGQVDARPADLANAHAVDFAPAFQDAFQRLDRQKGSHNLVNLVDLRHELPVSRQTFDAGLRQLRTAGRYSLSAAEGRHGISDAEREAGILEDGTLLLYVSRALT